MVDEAGTPHVKEVGPHEHNWVPVGTDGAGSSYEECSICNTRHVRSPAPGTAPGRADWLQGADWDAKEDAEPGTGEEGKADYYDPTLRGAVSGDAKVADVGEKAAQEKEKAAKAEKDQPERKRLADTTDEDSGDEDSEPSEAALRRMSKDDLADYGKSVGVELDKESMTKDDMVDEIMSSRS